MPLKPNEDEKLKAKFGPTKNENYYTNKSKRQSIPLQALRAPGDSVSQTSRQSA
jgi:hypothetical protein